MSFPEPYDRFASETLDTHESALELALEMRNGKQAVACRKASGHLAASRQIASGPESFYVINTAGGIVQGDRLGLEIKIGDGCSARILSQSANKIYGMDCNCAVQRTAIAVADGARLDYVPEPNIPYARSRYFQHTRIDLRKGSTLFYWDILYPGRYGRGEEFDRLVYFSRFEALVDGEPALVDTVMIDPARADPLAPGIMGGRRFQANVYVYGCEGLEKKLKGYGHCVNAAGLLLVRLLDDDALAMRKKLEKLYALYDKACGP